MILVPRVGNFSDIWENKNGNEIYDEVVNELYR
jgi:hypothetical protein